MKTTMEAVGATGAALVLEDGKIAWPEGRPGAYDVRLPLRWKRRQIGELVCDRDTPFTDEERALLASIAHHAAVALEHGRAVMRGVLAQEIHHRVKNNLQTVASLLRLQARARDVDPRKALEDSVNRILAIAAVHEVLTEQREEERRARASCSSGCARCSCRASPSGRRSSRRSSRSRSQATGRPRSRWSSASSCRTPSSTAATACGSSSPQSNGEALLVIADDGKGIEGDATGTGLSIVRALVRDELQGRLELSSKDEMRAEVTFPT